MVSLLILILSDNCAAWVGRAIGRVHLFGKNPRGQPGVPPVGSSDRLALSGSQSDSQEALQRWGRRWSNFSPLHIDDNLSIPFVTGAIMFFLGGERGDGLAGRPGSSDTPLRRRPPHGAGDSQFFFEQKRKKPPERQRETSLRLTGRVLIKVCQIS